MVQKQNVPVVSASRGMIVGESQLLDKIIPYTYGDNDPIVKSNCKLCQADCRAEAEAYYDSSPNYTGLVKWLKNNHSLEISYPSVRNHIIHHTKIAEKRQFLTEYSEDIKKWMNLQQDKVYAINTVIAILTKELIEIAAQGESMLTQDRCKNAETVKKLSDTLLLYQDKKVQYEQSLEPVVLVIKQLKSIIEDEIEHNSSAEAKKMLIKVLQRLQDNIGDIVVMS